MFPHTHFSVSAQSQGSHLHPTSVGERKGNSATFDWWKNQAYGGKVTHSRLHSSETATSQKSLVEVNNNNNNKKLNK
jgi:hypothetical protein